MLAPHIKSGALVAIGVAQEQHLDRLRLYRQWRRLDWPLFIDKLNLLDHKGVPIPMGIDEGGIVTHPRLRGEKDLQAFLSHAFRVDPDPIPKPALPHHHRGDDLFLEGRIDAAIAAYSRDRAPRALFRLGVALRQRYESRQRQAGDGQGAVTAWTEALQMRPDQYIWRRRIQQYGPRLDKPYNMFGWVEQARAEIRARGEEPVPLRVEPRGSELMGRGPVPTVQAVDPDPERKIPTDARRLVQIEPIVTPARVRPGHRVRVRLVFRVGKAYWNNETDPLTIYVEPAARLTVQEGLFSHPNATEAETRETRILEFEVQVAKDLGAGTHNVVGYGFYGVCEARGGVCRYLRQSFTVPVNVDPQAPSIR